MSMGHELDKSGGIDRQSEKSAQAAAVGCCAVGMAVLILGFAVCRGVARLCERLAPDYGPGVCEFCGEILIHGSRSSVAPDAMRRDSRHAAGCERPPEGSDGAKAPAIVAGGHS